MHQERLLFARNSHTSYKAAVAAQPSRAAKKLQYLQLLKLRGPLSDWETHQITGWPLSSVNSIRNSCEGIVKAGLTVSPYGKAVNRYGLATFSSEESSENS